MANNLDELNGDVQNDGRDVNVISKVIPVKTGFGSVLFEIFLWCLMLPGVVVSILTLTGTVTTVYIGPMLLALGVIPPLVFTFKKVSAQNYFMALEQKIQHDASEIDNYLEQRVQILKNIAVLVEKAVNVDKTVFSDIASIRSGNMSSNDEAHHSEERATLSQSLHNGDVKLMAVYENYPELKSHAAIEKAMSENSYLQKEITAAREVYNDAVLKWNREIFIWPTNAIVASKNGYTTRIPFALDKATKEEARTVFF